MLDLSLLRDAGSFPLGPSEPTRVAMVHHSFRTVSLRRGMTRQRFAAHFPALGLLSIAHSIRVDAMSGRLPPPALRYFDQEAYADEDQLAEAVRAWLGPTGRRILAASSYTPTIDRLEAFLGRFDPSAYLVVVGGAHATLAPDLDNAHVVVRGEGGAAMRHLLTTFLSPLFGEGPDAAGMCYRIDGQEVIRRQAFDRSIEQLPAPGFAYDLLPDQGVYGDVYATNFTRMLGRRPQVYICTQSCQARCTFCSTYLIHGKQVARPAALVARDIHHLVGELGHDSLEFHDDDLLQHPQFEELLEVMARSGISWFCYARVEHIDHATAERMARAGCRRVFLGVESMHQSNLDYYNKRTTVTQNREAVQHLDAAGIGVVAGFIIGSPDDTIDSILDDLERFLQLPLLAINCSVLSPDPGTAEFRRARRREDLRPALGGPRGLRLIPDPERFGIEAPMGLPSVCRDVSKRELNILQTLIDARFYAREPVWDGLVRGRTAAQRAVVADYYRFLRQTVDGLSSRDLPRRMVQCLELARAALDGGPWAETGGVAPATGTVGSAV